MSEPIGLNLVVGLRFVANKLFKWTITAFQMTRKPLAIPLLDSRAIARPNFQILGKMLLRMWSANFVSCRRKISWDSILILFRKSHCLLLLLMPLILHEITFIANLERRKVDTYMWSTRFSLGWPRCLWFPAEVVDLIYALYVCLP